MIALISPAKNLDFEYPAPVKKFTTPDFLSYSEELMAILKEYDALRLSKLQNMSYTLANLNFERNQQWQRPFTLKNAKQALFAFNGDVYTNLETSSLTKDQTLWAQDHFRILSGLYGMLRPLDLIQPYRLEMGTKLANSKGKTLYHFWTETLSTYLNEQMEQAGESVVVNLASNEYARAIEPSLLDKTFIFPVFKENKNGKLRVIGYPSKRARGMMSRFIIDNKITNHEDLKGFDRGGYVYREDESDETQYVFVR